MVNDLRKLTAERYQMIYNRKDKEIDLDKIIDIIKELSKNKKKNIKIIIKQPIH